mgnify:CR=1 FL=1
MFAAVDNAILTGGPKLHKAMIRTGIAMSRKAWDRANGVEIPSRKLGRPTLVESPEIVALTFRP